ncbi:nucleotidyltransferase [Myxococcaceae bacterium JPH2]|nr:nucleotidyltransferase [Myxococcaceae bacterium JPH2]
MLTVAQAFELFVQDLRLRDGEEREAQRQQEYVFNAMRQRLGPKESILSGSYGRKTAIRPLHDIDLFLIFSAGGSRRAVPEAMLLWVKEALEDEFRGKQARIQNRSVNIEFKTTGIGFDVVPAIADGKHPEVYWIPDRRRGEWIPSNPRAHHAACNAANERMGMKLKPLIKSLKRWNQLRGKPVPSFLLEVLVCECGDSLSPDDGYSDNMARLFTLLRERISQRCPEPAGLGPPLNEGIDLGYLQQDQQRLTEASRKAIRAVEMEHQGNMSLALESWRELLGTDFPVRLSRSV